MNLYRAPYQRKACCHDESFFNNKPLIKQFSAAQSQRKSFVKKFKCPFKKGTKMIAIADVWHASCTTTAALSEVISSLGS